MKKGILASVCMLCLGGIAGWGQTRVDLERQSKNVDFSEQPFTRVFKTGTTLPATCVVGDAFFKTNEQAGSNFFLCSSANSWSQPNNASHIHPLSGDLTAHTGAAVVTGLQSRAVATTAPAAGQVLGWNETASQWEPRTQPGSGTVTLGGDLSGSAGSAVVERIRGRTVAPAAPAAGQALVWNAASSQWEPQNQSGSGTVTLGGDLSGSAGSAVVARIQSRSVAATAPAAGQALVWNATSSQWEPQTLNLTGGGGNAAASAAQLADFRVERTSANTLTVGSACSAANRCNVRFGSMVYTFTSPTTVSLSSGTGTAYVHISRDGSLKVSHNLNLSCGAGCVAETGAGFPADSIPLFSWTAVSGSWDANGGIDQRAFLSSKAIVAGAGVLSTDNGGLTTIAVNPAQVGLRVGVPAISTAACLSGAWAADASFLYICYQDNNWRRIALTAF